MGRTYWPSAVLPWDLDAAFEQIYSPSGLQFSWGEELLHLFLNSGKVRGLFSEL